MLGSLQYTLNLGLSVYLYEVCVCVCVQWYCDVNDTLSLKVNLIKYMQVLKFKFIWFVFLFI
jgi:hypothetical protein